MVLIRAQVAVKYILSIISLIWGDKNGQKPVIYKQQRIIRSFEDFILHVQSDFYDHTLVSYQCNVARFV
jgi:hypothetical protein